jgi:hypothetical protein
MSHFIAVRRFSIQMAFQTVGRGFVLSPLSARSPAATPVLRALAVSAMLNDFTVLVGPRSFGDQGEVKCCVSCALAGAMEIIHPDWPSLAPLFHYYVTRVVDNEDDGAGGIALDGALTTRTTAE